MISQQFLDYIKRQLAAGVAQEDIRKALVINGLSEQDIAEGFTLAGKQPTAIAQTLAVPTSPQATAVAQITERPSSVLYFELLMYAAIAISIIGSLFSSYTLISSGTASYVIPTLLALPIVNILLVWIAAHRRANWARIVLLVFLLGAAMSLLSLFSLLFLGPSLIFSELGSRGLSSLASLASVALEIAAFCFVFSTSSNQWFTPQAAIPAIPGQAVNNTIWKKGIPGTNIGFMVASLLLVFGLDLFILYQSQWSLLPFWIEMLVVLAVFVVFFYLENYSFKKRFENSSSTLDSGISAVVVIRNIAFVLNFIPVIQLAGAAAVIFGGIPFLVLYAILLSKRSKVS